MEESLHVDPAGLEKYVLKVKQLRIGGNTPDEVVALLGEPTLKERDKNGEKWTWWFRTSMDSPTCTSVIDFDARGKVSGITIKKGHDVNTGDVIYCKP